MDGIATRVERRSEEITKKVAKAIVREVVTQTPYRSGKAISNWQASLSRGNIPEREPHSPFGSRGSNESAAIDAANAVIDAYSNKGERKAILIQNPVDYIGRLNEGYSSQAPAGFVEAAFQRGRAVAKREKLLDD